MKKNKRRMDEVMEIEMIEFEMMKWYRIEEGLMNLRWIEVMLREREEEKGILKILVLGS